MPRKERIVRWILFIPAALAAAAGVVAFVMIGAFAAGDEVDWVERLSLAVCLNIGAAFAFVYAGSRTAPPPRKAIALWLAAPVLLWSIALFFSGDGDAVRGGLFKAIGALYGAYKARQSARRD